MAAVGVAAGCGSVVPPSAQSGLLGVDGGAGRAGPGRYAVRRHGGGGGGGGGGDLRVLRPGQQAGLPHAVRAALPPHQLLAAPRPGGVSAAVPGSALPPAAHPARPGYSGRHCTGAPGPHSDHSLWYWFSIVVQVVQSGLAGVVATSLGCCCPALSLTWRAPTTDFYTHLIQAQLVMQRPWY